MLTPKRHGAHPRHGTAYLIAQAVLAATAAGIAALRPHTAYLLLPGGLALTSAAAGAGPAPRTWAGR